MSGVGPKLRERMKSKLRRYQIRGVRFLAKAGGRAILGDDMGVGKTIQAIGWTVLNQAARPIVIVCPASVKYGWQWQLAKHAGIRSVVLEGRTPDRMKLAGSDVWVINYDILKAWLPVLKARRPKLLIVDECHRIQNRKTQRTKACLDLGKKAPHVIAISGTPITSRPIQFFPILHLIAPSIFPSFWDYAFRYCDPKRAFRGRGWDLRGADNLDELHELVSGLMIRRMKADVLKELPPKTRTIIPVRLDNQAEYAEAEQDFLHWLGKAKGSKAVRRARGAEGLIRLGALQHLSARGKLATITQWIKDWWEDGGGKLVVFAIHQDILKQLHKTFPSAVRVDGTVTAAKREAAVRRFQKDRNCKLFLGNLKAAGEGIDLYASSTVLFTEIGWTAAEHEQAEDRVLRYGQKASRVDAFYFIGRDTVDEDNLLDVVRVKGQVCADILDGKRSSRRRMLHSYLAQVKGARR